MFEEWDRIKSSLMVMEDERKTSVIRYKWKVKSRGMQKNVKKRPSEYGTLTLI